MTSGDDSATFIDTNILVYATTASAPWHQSALDALERLHMSGVMLWVSRQILREYIAGLTRPQTFTVVQPLVSVIADVRNFEGMFSIAEDGPDVTAQLLALLEQVPAGGKQVHDANIVATMLARSIPRLLTHNEDDFARYAGVITVMPLSSFR